MHVWKSLQLETNLYSPVFPLFPWGLSMPIRPLFYSISSNYPRLSEANRWKRAPKECINSRERQRERLSLYRARGCEEEAYRSRGTERVGAQRVEIFELWTRLTELYRRPGLLSSCLSFSPSYSPSPPARPPALMRRRLFAVKHRENVLRNVLLSLPLSLFPSLSLSILACYSMHAAFAFPLRAARAWEFITEGAHRYRFIFLSRFLLYTYTYTRTRVFGGAQERARVPI